MGLDNLTAWWNRIRDSLWFVPALLTASSVALAFITVQIDVSGVLPTAPGGIWLFSGTASGARGVLTAIASGFITVTGVVFSITIVALQLASTQFTPRILRNFTADRANQLVLGVFIATFTYALLILRVVRGEQGGLTPVQILREGRGSGDPGSGAGPGAESVARAADSAARALGDTVGAVPDAAAGAAGAANSAASRAAGAAADSVRAAAEAVEAFVPNLSVTVAVALALVSIGFLIFFIDHAARSVQASVIIDRVTQDALKTVKRRFPTRVGEAVEESVEAVVPAAQGTVIGAEKSGYVQGVDQDALMEVLQADSLTIRMEPQIGDYILPGTRLATVWPAGSATVEQVQGTIRSAFILGPERTNHLDLELALIELADIAVKALSPGINDPTTAVLCVDRLAEVLLAAGQRDEPSRVRRTHDHGGTLILPRTHFSDLVDTAFDEIRHYGVENPRFAFSFLARLAELGRLLPHRHHTAVARHAAATLREARRVIHDEADLRRVENAAREALHALGVGSDTVPA